MSPMTFSLERFSLTPCPLPVAAPLANGEGELFAEVGTSEQLLRFMG